MSEILVRVRDKSNHDDATMDARLSKRGDVIAVHRDGHQWGAGELSHRDWRIIALPKVTESEASIFLGPGRANPDSGKLSTYRAFRLDVDSPGLPAKLRVALADDSRTDPVVSVPWTAAQLAKFKVARTRPDDPRVIGADPREIG